VGLSTEEFWPRFLENIQLHIRPQQFQTWFSNLRLQAATDELVLIAAPNEFIESWLHDKYLSVMEDAAESVLGKRAPVQLVVDSTITIEPEKPAETVLTPSDLAQRQGFRINPSYTFSNFVVGPSNRIAHAACIAIAESPGTTYNPLFLHGSVGLGKSHLLQATCHSLLGRFPNFRIRYLSCEQFVNDFISAIQRNELLAFRERYRQTDALMIDDVQFLTRAERSQEEFFHTFNALYNAQKQIVLTSDAPPGEMSALQERMVSRFKSGLVARLDPPHYETRVAILQKKAELRGLSLSQDVIHFVASRITTNIRELEGAITKIVGYANITGEKPDLELARKALHEPGSSLRSVTIDEILKAIAKYFNVRVTDIQSKKRHKSIAFPRQLCMHLARSLTNHSLEEIGGYFGGRDHSTVLYADSKIREQAKTDAELQRTLGHIASELEKSSSTKAQPQ